MDHSDPESTLRGLESNRRVFERFVLIRRLGAGGMGEVWLARDESLGVEVSLKFLPEHIRWSPRALDGHRAEALRTRAISHPHVIRVYDFVEDDTLAAIVMEYVEGRTLAAERLSRPDKVLSPEDIASWLPALAEAIDFLHGEAGVVHGDLKPSNILLTKNGRLKLADFGVARELGSEGSTIAGGTTAYSSPQRLLGAAPAPADDIYALGALLYEMLAGSPPFSDGDVAAQIELLEPASINLRRCSQTLSRVTPVAESWERAILSCLAKRADDRPGSASELSGRLLKSIKPARQGWRMARPAIVGVVTLAVTGLGWWWTDRDGRSDASGPIAPRPSHEYAESFVSGLAGWVQWGEPLPRVLDSYQGRERVFDSNGDAVNPSGATSMAVIAAPKGLELRCDVRLDVTNPAGCHLNAFVGLTFNPASWKDGLGAKGDGGAGAAMFIDYAGDSCWGVDPAHMRHAYAGARFVSEDGRMRSINDDVPRAGWTVDWMQNRWATLRIEIDADRTIRFYCDDRLLWAPADRVHPDVMAGQRVVIHGRSLGHAGKAYHDNLIVRGRDGSAIEVSTVPRPVGDQGGSRLSWTAANWEHTRSAGAEAFSWPAQDNELHLAAREGASLAVRSRRRFEHLSSVEFEVQPLLNSGGEWPDILRLSLEQAGEGVTTRWSVELRGGEIWLVERPPKGQEVTVGKAGTYAPGAWLTLVILPRPDGVLELSGSRINPVTFSRVPAPARPWSIALEVSGSADGATLRPPRVGVTR